jgi:hypothetical protein
MVEKLKANSLFIRRRQSEALRKTTAELARGLTRRK